MKISRRLACVIAFGLSVGLGACGGPPPPPPPTIISLTAAATADANLDGAGVPKPVQVQVLQLKGSEKLASADYFAVAADPKEALGDEFIAADSFTLPPGGTKTWEATLEEDANTIGLIVSYSQIDQAKWRVWQQVPLHATTPLKAEIGASEVTLSGAAE
jgi:type VI secretion system protein VasD